MFTNVHGALVDNGEHFLLRKNYGNKCSPMFTKATWTMVDTRRQFVRKTEQKPNKNRTKTE